MTAKTDLPPLPERFDCTNGSAQWCYGCYTMTRDDLGDYVLAEDYDALRNASEALQAEIEALRTEAEQHFQQAMSNGAKARAAQAQANNLRTEIEALRAEVDVLKAENALLREALLAIVDEVSDGLVPYSSDSYLPAHLVEQARAALAQEGEQ